MKSYLYVLSIGPVQDFIAAARRTRDLWFGSHLLSEISKAAAKKIDSSGGKLIFPGLKKGDFRLNSESDYNVANIILAELPGNIKPSDLNKEAQSAAKAEWKKYTNKTRAIAESIIRKGSIWDDQVEDVLEFNSAWVLLQGDYSCDRKKLMRLLAGRKSIRDFKQAKGLHGIPKSSLDGARESVLDKDKDLSPELAFKIRPSSGEQLCAIGLTKRLGSDGDERMSFPSVTRVSVDPWIRGLMKSGDDAKALLRQISGICKNSPRIASGSGKYYLDFHFDGQVLYPSRLAAMLKPPKEPNGLKSGWENRLNEADREDLRAIKLLVQRLQERGKDDNDKANLGLGEPDRYFAVLSADGDRMGRVISSMQDLDRDKHFDFSAKLSEFAEEARMKVEGIHHGCMVYSGGDDVLAFLPLDTCLQAARELHDSFSDMLDKYKDKDGKVPTLSVGIAIVHSMEPLEDLLRYAREAEKSAKIGKKINNETDPVDMNAIDGDAETGKENESKDDRDGLAVHLHTRSGGDPIRIREQWNSQGKISLDKRLIQWANLLDKDKIPDGAAYDIHEMARSYQAWNGVSKQDLGDLISKDAFRLLKRKKTGQGKENLKNEDVEELLNCVDSFDAISCLADELILARKLAVAIRQSRGNTQQMGVESQ
jgi:CRISPR-associated protein Cmr2